MSKDLLTRNIASPTQSVASPTRSTADSPFSGSRKKSLLKVNPASLSYLRSIKTEDLNSLCFADNLVTISHIGLELGEFTINIEPAKYLNEDCFLVNASSQGSIDNVLCGTTIQAFISKHLETLEQQHFEYVMLENNPLDRKTYISKQDKSFHINRIYTQGEEVQQMNMVYEEERMKGFISEGANLLLQRLFIVKNLTTDMEFLALDDEANICIATYKMLGEQQQTISDLKLRVQGQERIIHSSTDAPSIWHAFFAEDGHLTSRIQIGCPAKMKLLKLPSSIKKLSSKVVYNKQPFIWKDDIQIYSKFMDRKPFCCYL